MGSQQQQRIPLRTWQRWIATILHPVIREIVYTGGRTVDAEEDFLLYHQFRIETNRPWTPFSVYVTKATAQRFFRPFLSPQDRNLLHDLPDRAWQQQPQNPRRVQQQPQFRTPPRRPQGRQTAPVSQHQSTPLS